MKTIFRLLILILLLGGCTASEVFNDENSNLEQITDPKKRKQKAFEHFLNGSIAQNINDFATAIREFNEALNYDSSAGIYFALAKNYLKINKLANARKFASLAVNLDSTEIALDACFFKDFKRLQRVFSWLSRYGKSMSSIG